MKKKTIIIIIICVIIIFSGIIVGLYKKQNQIKSENYNENSSIKKEEKEMIIEINKKELIVKLKNNSSTQELLEMLKHRNIVVNARDYARFEKVGDLGFNISRNDENITTKPGDIVLYQGNQIALYYDTNSGNLTKLGEITNITETELKNLLGDGNITLTLKRK